MEDLRVTWDGVAYCVWREDNFRMEDNYKICGAIARKGHSTTYGHSSVRIYDAKDELDALKIFLEAQEQVNEPL